MNELMKLILVALSTTLGSVHGLAADTVIIESRNADGAPNGPAWTEVSGEWGRSKNKTSVPERASMTATNVSICVTSTPTPAIKISPEGLEVGTSYKVEITFGTSSTHVAAPDLVVAVSADGVSENTIPANTPALKGANADRWTTLGTITPSTDTPSLTLTYVSGTLSRTSRWYADAVRFIPQPASSE